MNCTSRKIAGFHWKDIEEKMGQYMKVDQNRKQILHMLEKFNLDLSNLKRAIIKKDGNKLFKLFSKTRKIRQAIVKAGQDINSPNFGRKN